MVDIYCEASELVKEILSTNGHSIKTLLFNPSDGHEHDEDGEGPRGKAVPCRARDKSGGRSPAVIALVLETLKYRSVLEQILQMCPQLERENRKTDKCALYVRVYDLVIGAGEIRGGGKLKKSIMQHCNALKTSLSRLLIRARVGSPALLLPEKVRNPLVLPRYVRINTLSTTVDEVTHHFSQLGYHLLSDLSSSSSQSSSQSSSSQSSSASQSTSQSSTSQSSSENKLSYFFDEDVPNLLVFPAGTDLHADAFVQSGKLMLQDKASCLPGHVAAPRPGSDAIDACAAPGNKTTHLAAQMGSSGGKLFAFEKDRRRYKLLQATLERSGAAALVEAVQGDFLQTDPADPRYARVETIIVDPSCSGSGIVGRYDHLFCEEATSVSSAGGAGDADSGSAGKGRGKRGRADAKRDKQARAAKTQRRPDGSAAASSASDDQQAKERIARLASFQEQIVAHALAFPAARRVVYSTCSIHPEENELVVRRLLDRHAAWQLAHVLPHWKNRGDAAIFPGAERCLRTVPVQDHTIGFFVACFERKSNQ